MRIMTKVVGIAAMVAAFLWAVSINDANWKLAAETGEWGVSATPAPGYIGDFVLLIAGFVLFNIDRIRKGE